MWLAENRRGGVLAQYADRIEKRGLNDTLIACVDGLKGFPDVINTVCLSTRIQLRIVHAL